MQCLALARTQQKLGRLMCLFEHSLQRLLSFGPKPLPGEAQTPWMKKGHGWEWQVGRHAGKGTFHRERSPAMAWGKDVGNMLKRDGKETETSFEPRSFNVGHDNIAPFIPFKINFIET